MWECLRVNNRTGGASLWHSDEKKSAVVFQTQPADGATERTFCDFCHNLPEIVCVGAWAGKWETRLNYEQSWSDLRSPKINHSDPPVWCLRINKGAAKEARISVHSLSNCLIRVKASFGACIKMQSASECAPQIMNNLLTSADLLPLLGCIYKQSAAQSTFRPRCRSDPTFNLR